MLNAANEVSVKSFLDGRIGFNDIADINCQVLDAHSTEPARELEAVLKADAWARKRARNICGAPDEIAAA